MNKTIKILLSLIGLLTVSNMLILYFLFTHRPMHPDAFYPRAGHFMEGPPEMRERPDIGSTGFINLRNCRMRLMNINRPKISKIRYFDKLIYRELIKENPDKEKIFTYIDSSHIFSKEMKESTIKYFLENSDSLTFIQKKFLLQNLLKRHVHKGKRKYNKMKGRK